MRSVIDKIKNRIDNFLKEINTAAPVQTGGGNTNGGNTNDFEFILNDDDLPF